MATIYVDDTASGSDNGTSKANAYNDFRDAWVSASEGDLILVADTHDQTDVDLHETYVSDLVLRVRSIDFSDDSYSPGASLDIQQTLEISPVEWSGITFDFHHAQPQFQGWNIWNDCKWTINQGTQFRFIDGYQELIDCSFESIGVFGVPGLFYTANNGSGTKVLMRNADLSLLRLDATAWIFYPYGLAHSEFVIEDTDLTDVAINSFDYAVRIRDYNASVYNNKLVLKNCILPSFTNHWYKTTGVDKCPTPGHMLEFINCFSGTSTVPSYEYLYKDYYGECELQSVVTRNMSDGTTSKLYAVTAYQDRCFEDSYLTAARTPKVKMYVPEDATKFICHIAHNGIGNGTGSDLTNEEAFVRISSPSEASPANAQNKQQTTKCNFGTVTDLTDASVGEEFVGGTLSVYQKIEVTIAPTEAGWIEAEFFLALNDTGGDNTCYIDFEIE